MSATQKLMAVQDKVTALRKTRPANRNGSKFANVNDIFEDGQAAAVITSTVDEILACKEAMKMLQEEIKGHERSMLESYGLNPKVLRTLVAAQSGPVFEDLEEHQAALARVYGAQDDQAKFG